MDAGRAGRHDHAEGHRLRDEAAPRWRSSAPWPRPSPTRASSMLVIYGKFVVGFYAVHGHAVALLFVAGFLVLGKRVIHAVRRDPRSGPAGLLDRLVGSRLSAHPGSAAEGGRAPPHRLSFVLPLGYSFNLDGSMMYCTFAVMFIAAGLRHPPVRRPADHHAAAADGDVEGHGRRAARLAGGDRRHPDLFRPAGSVDRCWSSASTTCWTWAARATNVVGNSVAAAVVAKWEGQIEEARGGERRAGAAHRRPRRHFSGRPPTHDSALSGHGLRAQRHGSAGAAKGASPRPWNSSRTEARHATPDTATSPPRLHPAGTPVLRAARLDAPAAAHAIRRPARGFGRSAPPSPPGPIRRRSPVRLPARSTTTSTPSSSAIRTPSRPRAIADGAPAAATSSSGLSPPASYPAPPTTGPRSRPPATDAGGELVRSPSTAKPPQADVDPEMTDAATVARRIERRRARREAEPCSRPAPELFQTNHELRRVRETLAGPRRRAGGRAAR